MPPELQGASGIAGASDIFVAFTQTVRMFLRDHPHLNRLVAGQEHSDVMIAWAIRDFLSDFAGSPPNLGFMTLEQMLENHLQSFATRGTAIALIQSVGILQTRNHLNFSDGGISVGVSDKAPELMQWLGMFQNKYEREKSDIKISMNINQLLGAETGVPSEYFFITGYLGAY